MTKITDIVTVTINMGGKSVPVGEFNTASSYFDGIEDSHLSIRKKAKPDYSKSLKVKGLSFKKFLARRVEKDGLAFVPNSDLWSARTNGETWIEAPIPKTPSEFLVYVHELGHCKSKQYQTNSGMFNFSACKGTIENETNVWLWALRYFRRLGFTIDAGCKELMKNAYGSYLTSARDKEHARSCAEKITKVSGVAFSGILNPVGPGRKKKNSSDTNPWVQLQEEKRKRQWRNVR